MTQLKATLAEVQQELSDAHSNTAGVQAKLKEAQEEVGATFFLFMRFQERFLFCSKKANETQRHSIHAHLFLFFRVELIWRFPFSF